jgi:hypothetical protein
MKKKSKVEGRCAWRRSSGAIVQRQGKERGFCTLLRYKQGKGKRFKGLTQAN